MTSLSYFIYSKFPGNAKWRLAVLATGRRDADLYIKHLHHGGKFSYSVVGGGSVDADCGAVTAAASQILKG